jgi:hypothetical protein
MAKPTRVLEGLGDAGMLSVPIRCVGVGDPVAEMRGCGSDGTIAEAWVASSISGDATSGDVLMELSFATVELTSTSEVKR